MADQKAPGGNRGPGEGGVDVLPVYEPLAPLDRAIHPRPSPHRLPNRSRAAREEGRTTAETRLSARGSARVGGVEGALCDVVRGRITRVASLIFDPSARGRLRPRTIRLHRMRRADRSKGCLTRRGRRKKSLPRLDSKRVRARSEPPAEGARSEPAAVGRAGGKRIVSVSGCFDSKRSRPSSRAGFLDRRDPSGDVAVPHEVAAHHGGRCETQVWYTCCVYASWRPPKR